MSVQTIAEKIIIYLQNNPDADKEKFINRSIKNQLPFGTCPEKKSSIEWKRQQVIDIVNTQLSGSAVGPSLLK